MEIGDHSDLVEFEKHLEKLTFALDQDNKYVIDLENALSIELMTFSLESMKDGRSCDRYGMSIEVIKACWKVKEFREALREVFLQVARHDGTTITRWQVVDMILLAKCNLPKEPKHLRPIVLADTLEKFYRRCLLLVASDRASPHQLFQVGGRQGFQPSEYRLQIRQSSGPYTQVPVSICIAKLDL